MQGYCISVPLNTAGVSHYILGNSVHFTTTTLFRQGTVWVKMFLPGAFSFPCFVNIKFKEQRASEGLFRKCMVPPTHFLYALQLQHEVELGLFPGEAVGLPGPHPSLHQEAWL